MTSDQSIRDTISSLVEDERALREQFRSGKMSQETERERLRAIEVELDQCWDLLRQRDAAREFGGDPDQASVRPPSTVESYKG